MLQISERGKIVPASPIRKLTPFAEAAKSRGTNIYHLNIGQPDIKTPANALAAVRSTTFETLAYSNSAGIQSYREKLVQYYHSVNIDLTADNILVTTGGSEAILFSFLSCLNPGDEVIIPEPFYANYNSFSVTAGVKVIPIQSNIENGFALPPIEEFEKKLTANTKAIMICNPNNPTGYLYSENELNALKEIVKKHSLYLFSDEAYREFCYEGVHKSALNLEGIEDNVVMMDTISKRFSACGARIGALVSRNKEVLSTALKFAQARLSPPTFGQILGEAAIDAPESYFAETKKEYMARRDTLVDRLNKIPGVFCPKPGGAFYAMASLPVDDTEDFCRWMLESFSYNNSTVMLAPASGFYSTKGSGKNQVRLAYVINRDAINGAMDCLEKALEQYNSHKH